MKTISICLIGNKYDIEDPSIKKVSEKEVE